MNRIMITCMMLLFAVGAEAQPAAHADGEEHNGVGAGLFIGTPSSIGFRARLETGPIVAGVSGGSWGKSWWGYQADAGLIVSQTGRLVQSIDLIAGRFANTTRDESGVSQHEREEYLGLAYDVSYAGFFVQLGLAAGRGDYPNPQLVYQFGYLFFF